MNESKNNFLEALHPRVFTVCGLDLKPFSLGHYLLLERYKCPFITDDENASIKDITIEKGEFAIFKTGVYHFFLTILICGQSYNDSQDMLDSDDLFKEVFDQFYDNLKIVMKKNKSWNILSEIKKFNDYVRYYFTIPLFEKITSGGNDKPSGLDWKSSMILTIKKEYNYSDNEVLNFPLRRMFELWVSLAESAGSIRVLDAFEVECIEKASNKR